MFVEDNCRGIDTVLKKGLPGEIYNIGGGNLLPNIELTRMILSFVKKDGDFIEYVNGRPGHDKRYALDSSKITGLGWEPSGDFAHNMAKTVDWYTNNDKWWRPLKERAEIIEW